MELFEGFEGPVDLKSKLPVVRDILLEIEHSGYFMASAYSDNYILSVTIELDRDLDLDGPIRISDDVYDTILRVIEYMSDFRHKITLFVAELDDIVELDIDTIGDITLLFDKSFSKKIHYLSAGDFIRIDFKKK